MRIPKYNNDELQVKNYGQEYEMDPHPRHIL
jgi:hypothetical protein